MPRAVALKVRHPALAVLAETGRVTLLVRLMGICGSLLTWVDGGQVPGSQVHRGSFLCSKKHPVHPVRANKEDPMGAIRELEVAIRTSA